MNIISLIATSTAVNINLEPDYYLTAATIALGAVTALMAFFTWRLAKSTSDLAKDAKESSYREIGVQSWLELNKRFASNEFLDARRNMANYISGQFGKMDSRKFELKSDTVLLFFEDVGTLIHHKFLDEKLAEDTFGYFARRWWHILKDYVVEVRKERNNRFLYEYFQEFANSKTVEVDTENTDELKDFLKEERELKIYGGK